MMSVVSVGQGPNLFGRVYLFALMWGRSFRQKGEWIRVDSDEEEVIYERKKDNMSHVGNAYVPRSLHLVVFYIQIIQCIIIEKST